MERDEFGVIACLMSVDYDKEKAKRFKDYVSTKIKSDFFTNERVKKIFTNILSLDEFNAPILAEKTGENISSMIELENIFSIVTLSKIDSYCWKILEDWKNSQIKGHLEQQIIDYDEVLRIKGIKYFDDDEDNTSDKFLRIVDQQYQHIEDENNIPTGYLSIDRDIKGFRKSEAIFIGGRPASGKTTLGINIAYNIAKNKKKVLFCSLEMSKVELHSRLVKSISEVPYFDKATADEINKVIKISKAIDERLPIIIYDKPSMTIEDIFVKSHQEKPEVVFIDHLAILKSVKNFKSRYEEVSYLSARVKVLARELDIPVICLCQLNRALESRDTKAPTLADIRDSGSVEQDGDIIAFVYRQEYHLLQNEPKIGSKEHTEWEEQLRTAKGKAQVIIAKNRRGKTGKYDFDFIGNIYKFVDNC